LVNLYNRLIKSIKSNLLPEIRAIGGLDYSDTALNDPLSSDSDDDLDSETYDSLRKPLPKAPNPQQDTLQVGESLEYTAPAAPPPTSSCRLGNCLPPAIAGFFGLRGGYKNIKRRNKLKKIKSKKLNKVKSKKLNKIKSKKCKKIKSKKRKKNKTYKKTRRNNK